MRAIDIVVGWLSLFFFGCCMVATILPVAWVLPNIVGLLACFVYYIARLLWWARSL